MTPEERARADLVALHLRLAVAAGAELIDFVRVYGAVDDNAATKEEIEDARQMYCRRSSNDMDIQSPTLASRGNDGLWVLGWFYLPLPEADEEEGAACHNCGNTTWMHDPETGEDHCAACGQVQ